MTESQSLSLDRLKPLTTDQYDQARARAITRVQQRIGERPTRAQFKRELGSIFTLLDLLALIAFIPALIISSIHVATHMTLLANASYSPSGAIGRDLYVVAHALAFIPLAEASILLFSVMFAMSAAGWRRWVFLALAAAATGFVLIANIQSGIGVLESILAPLFTVGISLHLESLIVRSLKRRDAVNERYLDALAIYEAASADPAKHPEYLPLLRAEVWQRLMQLGTNKAFADAPTSLKHAAVRREMQRDSWSYEDAPPYPAAPPQGAAGAVNSPISSSASGAEIEDSAPAPDPFESAKLTA